MDGDGTPEHRLTVADHDLAPGYTGCNSYTVHSTVTYCLGFLGDNERFLMYVRQSWTGIGIPKAESDETLAGFHWQEHYDPANPYFGIRGAKQRNTENDVISGNAKGQFGGVLTTFDGQERVYGTAGLICGYAPFAEISVKWSPRPLPGGGAESSPVSSGLLNGLSVLTGRRIQFRTTSSDKHAENPK